MTNESEMSFEKKMKECEKLKDPVQRHECKINALEKEIRKIGSEQKPIQWCLEVIAEGTSPMFDKIDRSIKDLQGEMNEKFEKVDDQFNKINKEIADLKKGQSKIAGEPPESLYK